MVLHFDAHSGSNETIETPSGTTSIVHVEAPCCPFLSWKVFDQPLSVFLVLARQRSQDI